MTCLKGLLHIIFSEKFKKGNKESTVLIACIIMNLNYFRCKMEPSVTDVENMELVISATVKSDENDKFCNAVTERLANEINSPSPDAPAALQYMTAATTAPVEGRSTTDPTDSTDPNGASSLTALSALILLTIAAFASVVAL